MDRLCYLPATVTTATIPVTFPSPFASQPLPLAQYAAEDLQQRLDSEWGRGLHDFFTSDGGKMFGVLVVRDQNRRLGYLSAFSGKLGGCWLVPGFVPPVFDDTAQQSFLPAGELALATLTRQIDALEQGAVQRALGNELAGLTEQAELERQRLVARQQRQRQQRHQQRVFAETLPAARRAALLHELSLASQRDRRERRQLTAQWQARLAEVGRRLALFTADIDQLRRRRARLSLRLQRRVFATYRLRNAQGTSRALTELFPRAALPPAGSGDCAAPKLLQYAHEHGLQALALAEFWWGRSPATGVRHHRHFYPACRGKCGPLLPFMLAGLTVAPPPRLHNDTLAASEPGVIYEDDVLLVVDKPPGLLSVPGKQVQDSVLTRLRRRFPDADGPLLVHRLDMATSGLLLVAKTASVHKALQRQFIRRQIEKRYVAVVATAAALAEHGSIELPLRVDLDDRPRQCVCRTHGKQAKTRWRLVEQGHDRARVYFYPLTGRTHQLRVHAAHRDGLGAPIIGDELYGRSAERLLLHAERLRFYHPLQQRTIEVHSPVPF